MPSSNIAVVEHHCLLTGVATKLIACMYCATIGMQHGLSKIIIHGNCIPQWQTLGFQSSPASPVISSPVISDTPTSASFVGFQQVMVVFLVPDSDKMLKILFFGY